MKLSRWETIAQWHGDERAAAYEVDPGPLAWLLELWADAGQARVEFGMSGGMLLGLGWSEIAAWVQGAREHDLAPVYLRGIMALSAAYAAESMAAREMEREAPYEPGKG